MMGNQAADRPRIRPVRTTRVIGTITTPKGDGYGPTEQIARTGNGARRFPAPLVRSWQRLGGKRLAIAVAAELAKRIVQRPGGGRLPSAAEAGEGSGGLARLAARFCSLVVHQSWIDG